MAEFDCPHCGKTIRIEDQMAQVLMPCPACKNILDLSLLVEDAPESPEPTVQKRERDDRKFPGRVKAAAIMWIVMGMLGIESILLSLQYGLATLEGNFSRVPWGPIIAHLVIVVVFLVYFVIAGVRVARGCEEDTLGHGIVSLIYGVVVIGISVFQYADLGPPQLLGCFVALMAFVGGGLLAIGGRSDYKKWREHRADDDNSGRKLARFVVIAAVLGILIPNAVLLAYIAWPSKPPPNAFKKPIIQLTEEPAPVGWTVLFRSDDPSHWNNPLPNLPGQAFAIPVRQAHSSVRYLRLKRMDTGETLIVSVAHKDLASKPSRIPERGYAWNGNKYVFIGTQLGVIQTPPTREIVPNFIAVYGNPVLDKRDCFTGSGFALKNGSAGQHWCWKGKEIPRTSFEIAVATDLTEQETREFLNQAPPDVAPGARDRK